MQFDTLSYNNKDRSFSMSCTERTGHYTMSANHFHDSYEIYYLLSGERYYFIKSRTFHITRGDLVLINTHDLHKTIDTGVPEHQRILISFKDNFIMATNHSLQTILHFLFAENSNVVRLSISDQSYTENLLLQMLEEIKYQRTGFELSLQSFLIQLLVHTCRYKENTQVNSFEHPSSMHRKVSEIVQYMNRNYHENLTLPFISEKFFISQYHLSRIFKEGTGFTFIEYLNSVRVREAQRMLRESKWKVIQIAEKSGFGSIAHFGRVFKSVTGFAPLDYRKINYTPPKM